MHIYIAKSNVLIFAESFVRDVMIDVKPLDGLSAFARTDTCSPGSLSFALSDCNFESRLKRCRPLFNYSDMHDGSSA